MTFVREPARPPRPEPEPRAFRWRGVLRGWDDVPSESPPRERRKYYAISVPAETRDAIAAISRRLRVTMRDALSVVLADILEESNA